MNIVDTIDEMLWADVQSQTESSLHLSVENP